MALLCCSPPLGSVQRLWLFVNTQPYCILLGCTGMHLFCDPHCWIWINYRFATKPQKQISFAVQPNQCFRNWILRGSMEREWGRGVTNVACRIFTGDVAAAEQFVLLQFPEQFFHPHNLLNESTMLSSWFPSVQLPCFPLSNTYDDINNCVWVPCGVQVCFSIVIIAIASSHMQKGFS